MQYLLRHLARKRAAVVWQMKHGTGNAVLPLVAGWTMAEEGQDWGIAVGNCSRYGACRHFHLFGGSAVIMGYFQG